METLQIRWHGRGGQGTVTAAKTLAEATIETDFFFQAFPEYGPERMGAPIKAYNIISSDPILTHCPVTNPNLVAVVDSSLIYSENILDGATDDAKVIVNSDMDPADIARDISAGGRPVFTVDANRISLDCLGRIIPNTPMLGALLRATGILPLDTFIECIKHMFVHKKFSEKVILGNVDAIRRAYEEVKGL